MRANMLSSARCQTARIDNAVNAGCFFCSQLRSRNTVQSRLLYTLFPSSDIDAVFVGLDFLYE